MAHFLVTRHSYHAPDWELCLTGSMFKQLHAYGHVKLLSTAQRCFWYNLNTYMRSKSRTVFCPSQLCNSFQSHQLRWRTRGPTIIWNRFSSASAWLLVEGRSARKVRSSAHPCESLCSTRTFRAPAPSYMFSGPVATCYMHCCCA